jgi:hypothetical protein
VRGVHKKEGLRWSAGVTSHVHRKPDGILVFIRYSAKAFRKVYLDGRLVRTDEVAVREMASQLCAGRKPQGPPA